MSEMEEGGCVPRSLSDVAPWQSQGPTAAVVQVSGGELEVVDVSALDDAVYRFVRDNYDGFPGARDLMETIAPLIRIRSLAGR